MKNKRIGKILGKTILLDTPPYGDKKARANEIVIEKTDSISNNDIDKYIKNLRFCVVKNIISTDEELSFESYTGKIINIYKDGRYTPIAGLFGKYDELVFRYVFNPDNDHLDIIPVYNKKFDEAVDINLVNIIVSPDERIPNELKMIKTEIFREIIECLGIGTIASPAG